MSGDAVADGLLVASRMLWYAGLVGVIGASAFRLSVSWAANGATAELGREAATTGLAAAAALLSGLLARLYAQTYAAFGVEERVTAALLLEVAVDLPPWSTGWMFQFAAAGISLPALIVARAGRRQGWAVAYVAAIALAASAPLTGHAVAQAEWYVLPVVLQASHVLGAGLWIGGLFVLLVVGVARAGRLRPQVLAALVNAFSPLALCGAGLVALTGADHGVPLPGRGCGSLADAIWTHAPHEDRHVRRRGRCRIRELAARAAAADARWWRGSAAEDGGRRAAARSDRARPDGAARGARATSPQSMIIPLCGSKRELCTRFSGRITAARTARPRGAARGIGAPASDEPGSGAEPRSSCFL
jgi:putative copper export protein